MSQKSRSCSLGSRAGNMALPGLDVPFPPSSREGEKVLGFLGNSPNIREFSPAFHPKPKSQPGCWERNVNYVPGQGMGRAHVIIIFSCDIETKDCASYQKGGILTTMREISSIPVKPVH